VVLVTDNGELVAPTTAPVSKQPLPPHASDETATPVSGLCAHELFELRANCTPDAVAVVFGDQRVTYRELDRRANQVAHLLRRHGVGPDVLVGVCLRRRPELVVALLGVWKAGGAYVPLDPAYPLERLAFMAGDAAVRVLLTEDACRGLFADVDVPSVCLDADDGEIARASTDRPVGGAGPADLAYVMYTSGSTGKPKGAMIEHRGLVNYLGWAIKEYGVRAGDSVPVHSSISFDLTVTSLYPPLLVGGQVELLPEDVGAQNLVAALRRNPGRGLVKITPAHLDLLAQQFRPDDLAGLARVFVIGGESLLAETVEPWRRHAPATRLINEYGPTETVVGCCIHEVQPDDLRTGSIPIGGPIENTQLYVLGPDRELLPDGETGELYIGGAGVARGYLNRPDLTAERFIPNPFLVSGGVGAPAERVGGESSNYSPLAAHHSPRLYKTGDLARRRPDGTLEYLGRTDDQVKVRGYRIELGEIEAALRGHPAVQACAVVAREDVPGDRQLVGYVVPEIGATATDEDVLAFLRQRLPEYMVPARLVRLAALPLVQNGKVDRKALPAPAMVSDERPDPTTHHSPLTTHQDGPRNDVERTLAAIWSKLLNRPTVGVHDDFFDLGGHSLLAIKVMSRIRDELGIDLSVQHLFDHPTVAGMAAMVDELTGPPAADPGPRIAPRPQPGPAPLSFSQEQIWFLHQLAPDSPAYNIVDVVTLAGAYDGPALRAALAELVRRHEALRTAFVLVDGRPAQVAVADVVVPVHELDLTALPEAGRAAEWARVARDEGRRTFDLSRPPLVRATVVDVSPLEHRVLLVVHHIVADEWSMEVIQDEVARLYAAFGRQEPSPLPALPIQYADFAAWQRDWFQRERLQDQADYWTADLAGAMPVLALPTDRPRPQAQTFDGATEHFAIPPELTARLHALNAAEQTTPFMALETAFAALLHRYTGQPDLLVGTPITGRTRSETERLVGCFLNTVVLRSQLAPGQTFRGLLRQARVRTLGAFAHADLPFERLVAAFAPDRDPGHTPLFQVMFILHAPFGPSLISSVSGHHALENGSSKFDLTLYLSETAAGFEGLLEYNTDLFEAETVRRIGRAFVTLLEAALADPDQPVAGLPLLTEGDRRRLLVDWNDTTVPWPDDGPRLLHELVERQARRTPDAVAIVCEGATLNYGDLDRRSAQLAHHLHGLGVGPDALVGLLVDRSPEMVVALLGILRAGGAYIPLDPAFPPARLAHMVADSRLRVLVTSGALDRDLPAHSATVVRLDADADAIARHPAEPPAVAGLEPHHLAYVLYTSGSTGLPKGVAVPHAAVVNFLRSMAREPGLKAADTLLAVTTLSFDIAGMELYLPLTVGARVAQATRADAVDPNRLMKLMRETGCTVLQATPATWRGLLAAGWAGGPIKALCGGEAMPPDLAAALLPRCGELWNMYGPTETTIWSTVHRVTAGGPVPIGKPIANTQVYVLDAARDPVPPGVVGELYIGGSGLARGYLDRPELTAERFVPNPFAPGTRLYRTGDLARWRTNGRLECLGRTDTQVKVRGYRIELGEIEAVLARHPAVRQAVVVARDAGAGDKQLVAYVVPVEQNADLVEQLRAALRGALPDYMVPAHVVALEALPLTPNGKVDRNALPAPGTGDAAEAPGGYQAPRNDLEISLAAAWEKVLGLPRVGITDNFFDLGGTSLSALKLITEMAATSGIEITLGGVLGYPTIASLVESLGSGAAGAASMVVPLQPAGTGRPIFCLCGINIYRHFARSLGCEQPVYGVYVGDEQTLAAQAMRGEKLDISVDRLAAAYHDAIVRAAPHGPYRLCGISFGGILAMEVASRLRQSGETVEVVLLLDTLLPRGVRRRWGKWARNAAAEIARGGAGRVLRSAITGIRKRLLGSPAGNGGKARSAEEAFDLRREAFYQAIGSWRADHLTLDFDVVLFRAEDVFWRPHIEFDQDYGWGRDLGSRLRVVPVPGDHLGILEPPNVTPLAQKARQVLGGETAVSGG
jgi:amino acid adenylation domain-containing protein